MRHHFDQRKEKLITLGAQWIHTLSKVCTQYSLHGVPSRVDDLSVENSTTTVSPTLR